MLSWNHFSCLKRDGLPFLSLSETFTKASSFPPFELFGSGRIVIRDAFTSQAHMWKKLGVPLQPMFVWYDVCCTAFCITFKTLSHMNTTTLLHVKTRLPSYLWLDVYTYLFGFTRCEHGYVNTIFYVITVHSKENKHCWLYALKYLMWQNTDFWVIKMLLFWI